MRLQRSVQTISSFACNVVMLRAMHPALAAYAPDEAHHRAAARRLAYRSQGSIAHHECYPSGQLKARESCAKFCVQSHTLHTTAGAAVPDAQLIQQIYVTT